MLWGVEIVVPDGSLIRLGGVDRKKTDVVSELQAVLAQYASVDSTAAVVRAERAQLREALPAADALLRHLRAALVVFLGQGNPELEKFGVRIREPRKPTVQQKVLAGEKARRTRALRGTLGPRQKKAIRYTGEPTLVLGEGTREE
jgi:hypothetical protein